MQKCGLALAHWTDGRQTRHARELLDVRVEGRGELVVRRPVSERLNRVV